MASSSSQVIKGAYYPASVSESVPPSSINTKLFTHIYYAFITPDDKSFEFTLDQQQKALILIFTSTLHAKNPPVKTLFAIGGAADLFSRMASNQDSRRRFILSSIKLARELNFDGFDLNWKFPKSSVDMQNLGCLLDEWRKEVDKEASSTGHAPLLLTAAVYYSPKLSSDVAQLSYPSDSIQTNLDWINIMTYDYCGSSDTKTGAHAQLYDPQGKRNKNTSDGLQSWFNAGVPKNKLIMGLPLYGKTWKLKDPKENLIGAPAVGVGPGDGSMTYSEIIDYNTSHNAIVAYDGQTVSYYSVNGTNWLGYDDIDSVTQKIKFAQTFGIQGYFFWDIHGDRDWIISQTASGLWGGSTN